jgi:hypothetical protein
MQSVIHMNLVMSDLMIDTESVIHMNLVMSDLMIDTVMGLWEQQKQKLDTMN